MNDGVHHSISFAAYTAEERVNQSVLKMIATKSPAHVACAVNGTATQGTTVDDSTETVSIDAASTSRQLLGTLVHAAILEPDGFRRRFQELYAVKPKGMKFSTREGNAWRQEHLSHGFEIISAVEAGFLFEAAEKVLGHPFARRLFEVGQSEVSLFATDPGTGLKLKARIDFLPFGDVIPDLKTTEDAGPRGFRAAVRRYRYHLQGAFYLWVANLLNLERKHFVLVAIEKKPPYAVACYKLSDRVLKDGMKIAQEALEIYARCEQTGVWPGYGEGVKTIDFESYDG